MFLVGESVKQTCFELALETKIDELVKPWERFVDAGTLRIVK